MRSIHVAALAVLAATLAGLASCVSISPGVGAEFVGSGACRKCHLDEYRSWQSSLHARMVRKRDAGILKDAAAQWAEGGPGIGNVTGRKAGLDDVEYVVGSHWKQRYLIRNETTGGLQFMDKQFNRMSRKWEPYGQKNDWDTQCATCHTTGYRVTRLDEASGRVLEADMREHNVGCEACHGPGSKHAKSEKRADIYGFEGRPHDEQAMVCGYCHSRFDNHRFKTRQGNSAEHVPHPKAGESFRAGTDDWRTWYPQELIAPGVYAKDPFEKDYAGDLKGMWLRDEAARKSGVFDAAKHHQQYQEYLQSTHYTKEKMSCGACHSAHAAEGKPAKVAAQSCAGCHKGDGLADIGRFMPATGKTADNLFVRSHTFSGKQSRKGGPVAAGEAVTNR